MSAGTVPNGAVFLVDGTPVTSDSSEWKVECLARHVLSIRGVDHRRAWILDFEKRAGALAAADLMEAMQRVHAARAVRARATQPNQSPSAVSRF